MDKYATVVEIVTEIVEEQPPLLYDLTALQMEANRLLGLTASESLKCAQKLYEAGLLTYPRTSSHYITPDMEQSVMGLISSAGGTTSNGSTCFGTERVDSGKNSLVKESDSLHVSVNISSEDFFKLEKWTNRPDDEKYIANKDVYDNPKYFDQESGKEIWPGENGDRNTDGFVDGKYVEKDIEVGSKIDRYGGNNGTFFGETGTPVEKRAMSPNSAFDKYNQYEVIKRFPVREGKVASWFGKPGGGKQFKIKPTFEKTIRSKLRPGEQLIDGMVRMRYLKRV